MKRRRIAAITAALITVLVVPSPARATAWARLPDLRQAPVGCPGGFEGDPATCADWDVCLVADEAAANGTCVTTGPVRAARLRFTTSVDNVGDGPLLIHAHRDGTGEPLMSTRQAFQSRLDRSIPGSYREAQHPLDAKAYYEPAPTHVHWHLLGFEHFQLRTPDGRTLVADRKNGFCLGDRYEVPERLPHKPRGGPERELARFLLENRCRHHEPQALDVVQGISVGSGDDYDYEVDFQWLDISRVPSGVYDVVNVVNSDRTLVEKDYSNNASSMAIRIQWPGGAVDPPTWITTPPAVELVRSCPGAERCAAT